MTRAGEKLYGDWNREYDRRFPPRRPRWRWAALAIVAAIGAFMVWR